MKRVKGMIECAACGANAMPGMCFRATAGVICPRCYDRATARHWNATVDAFVKPLGAAIDRRMQSDSGIDAPVSVFTWRRDRLRSVRQGG